MKTHVFFPIVISLLSRIDVNDPNFKCSCGNTDIEVDQVEFSKVRGKDTFYTWVHFHCDKCMGEDCWGIQTNLRNLPKGGE